jgi:hypothetical protein
LVAFKGMTDRPRVGDRFEITGELWRVVKIIGRAARERESS